MRSTRDLPTNFKDRCFLTKPTSDCGITSANFFRDTAWSEMGNTQLTIQVATSRNQCSSSSFSAISFALSVCYTTSFPSSSLPSKKYSSRKTNITISIKLCGCQSSCQPQNSISTPRHSSDPRTSWDGSPQYLWRHQLCECPKRVPPSKLWNRSWEGSWDWIIKLKKINDIVCKITLSSSASICEDLWSFGSLWKSSKVFWTKKSFTPRTSFSPLSPRLWSHWPPSLSCPIQHVVWILVPGSSQRTRDGEVSQAALARKLINGYKKKVVIWRKEFIGDSHPCGVYGCSWRHSNINPPISFKDIIILLATNAFPMSCMSPNRPSVPNLIHQIGGFQQRLKDPERNKTGECEDSTYLTLEKKKQVQQKTTRKSVKFRNLQLIFKQNVCQKSKIVIQWVFLCKNFLSHWLLSRLLTQSWPQILGLYSLNKKRMIWCQKTARAQGPCMVA